MNHWTGQYQSFDYCASQVKFIKKRVPQNFLGPIQKRALSWSVQLEVVYLKALLYIFIKNQKLLNQIEYV